MSESDSLSSSITVPVPQSSDGYFSTPKWLGSILKCPLGSIARMEVKKEHALLYGILAKFCANQTVDINADELSQKSDSKKEDQLLSLECNRLIRTEAPDHEERESSSLDPMLLRNAKKSAVPFLSSMKILAPLYKPEYTMGTGISKTKINGETVVIIHFGTGPPACGVNGEPKMHFAIHCFSRKQSTLMKMIDEVLMWYHNSRPHKEGHYKLYTLIVRCNEARWEMQGLKAGRSLNSIILPLGMLDSIVQDFAEFLAYDTKKWYIEHGLPHRRSYLFHGPPGVGKTSTIRSLAGVFRRPACFLSLGDKDIGNKHLQDAMKRMPNPSILVIEDIDSLFNIQRKSMINSDLTFSALLNALDGLLAADGIVTILTTNHIERLDPALMRAGRVDRRFAFQSPTHQQVKMLFLSFYPKAEDEIAHKFADDVFSRPEREARSIATLQEHFIFTRNKTAKESAALVENFFKEFYPNSREAEV